MTNHDAPQDGFSGFDITRLRRIVTGVDDEGRAQVTIEDTCPHSGTNPKFPGVAGTTIWREAAEIDFGATGDLVTRYSRVPTGGSQLFLSQLDPGVYVAPHVTKTVDHHFVISGEITCIFKDSEFTARAGDVIIQRGTEHAWENRGTVPFISVIFMRSAHDQA